MTMPREREALKQAVLAMREKMRATQHLAPDLFDLKHSPGGIIDVEFLVQYLLLAHAKDHPVDPPAVKRYISSAWGDDKDPNNLQGGGGNEGHLTNWLECIRSGKSADLRATVRECHLSTSLVHASNVALRTGAELPQGEIKERIKANTHLGEAFDRAAEHLAKNGFAGAKLQVGALTLDPSTEKFTGEGAEKANTDLIAKREGRGEFKIPTYLA
jgi:glutamine synthetase adenylyltransferase